METPLGDRRKLSIAYGCHALVGAFHGFITVAGFLDFTAGQVLGMLVGIPLALPAFAALLVALGMTVRLWRHWPLVALVVLLVVPLTAYGPLRSATGLPQDVLLLGYDVAALSLGAWWFFRGRYAAGDRPRAPRPAVDRPAAPSTEARRLHLAYGCYLWVALFHGVSAAISLVPSEPVTTIAFVLVGPLFAPTTLIGVLGIGLTVGLRRHRRLLMLGALLAIGTVPSFLSTRLPIRPEALLIPYDLAAMFFGIQWFRRGRGRPRGGDLPAEG